MKRAATATKRSRKRARPDPGRTVEPSVYVPGSEDPRARARRETVESIVIAVILAFLFRAFVAEAFVIPTGSMAPTLQGRHKDVVCPKCGAPYRTGASLENHENGPPAGTVVATTCPFCRYVMTLNPARDPNQRSFAGDRILVSKFSYQLGEPERWDVIVFKYPGNAKQNYIKRLVGLPGETIRIECGDVYARRAGETEFHILRKPDRKLIAMLQAVDDTKYLADDLIRAGWPSRWQPWSPEAGELGPLRRLGEDREGVLVDAREGPERWVRYRHILPTPEDWRDIERGVLQADSAPEKLTDVHQQLITDFYAYNAFAYSPSYRSAYPGARVLGPEPKSQGLHWVGDLACEADAEVLSGQGELVLDLVEAGVHHQCRIDVATGRAVLSLDWGAAPFVDGAGRQAFQPAGRTPVRGPGRYRLRLSNVDNELRLWVDGRRVAFDGPTTYERPARSRPKWTRGDPGDLAPVGVGASKAAVRFRRLRVLRDVYYGAVKADLERGGMISSDYDAYHDPGGMDMAFTDAEVLEILAAPREWATTPLFDLRRAVEFQLGEGEYFPLGDNSPQSKDARLWELTSHVDHRLLTGKALLIYWPHPWRRPIPFWPNWRRIGLIH